MAKKPVSYLAGSMIVGTAIGALVGMLVAPKAGRDTRSQIRTRAGETPKYLASQLKTLPERSRVALQGLPAKWAERVKNGKNGRAAEVAAGEPDTDPALSPGNDPSPADTPESRVNREQ